MAESDVLQAVRDALDRKLERVILIKADQDASYSTVMTLLDQMQRAGIEDIGLVTERKVGSGGVAAAGGE